MIQKVVQEPGSVLRKIAPACDHIQSVKSKKLTADMLDTMREKKGVGIAAPQIGESVQVIIVDTNDGPLTLFNPQIVKTSKKKESGEEGCLSVVGVYGMVPRFVSVEVEAIDMNGQPVHLKATNFFARVLQHEVDHLNGVLFIDRATKITQGKDLLKTTYGHQ